MIRIVLSSDHPFVRSHFYQMLSVEENIEVIRQAKSIPETLWLCKEIQPQILIIDIKDPADAAAIVVDLKDASASLGMILLTELDQPSIVHALLKAGVKGYLLYSEADRTIVEAIHTVSRGGIWVDQPAIPVPQTGYSVQRNSGATPTRRETEVIHLLGEEWSNDRIAQQLGVAERTVRFHLDNVREKLHASNRTEVVIAAIRQGWLNP